jgi:dipeptidyl aminopeptidase/acylaminoacyl peptidase
MRRRAAVGGAIAAGCVVVLIGVVAGLIAGPWLRAVPEAPPRLPGRIAYPADGEVRVRDLNGGGSSRLTEGQPLDWSPDGTELLIERHGGLYVVHPDGSETRATPEGTLAFDGSWSPDGQRIVFQAAVPPYLRNRWKTGVAVIDADGSDLEIIRPFVQYDVGVPGSVSTSPEWSPDGEWIAFVEGPHREVAGGRLSMMHPDGSGVTRLTNWRNWAWYASGLSWSPDGSEIAFIGQYRCAQRSDRSCGPSVEVIDVASRRSRHLELDQGGTLPHQRGPLMGRRSRS